MFFLSLLSDILAPIGFAITILTFCNTRRIKDKILKAVDKNDLNKNLSSIKTSLENQVHRIDDNATYEVINDTRYLLIELLHKYGSMNQELEDKLNKTIKLCTINKEYNINHHLTSQITADLTAIKIKLEKETIL